MTLTDATWQNGCLKPLLGYPFGPDETNTNPCGFVLYLCCLVFCLGTLQRCVSRPRAWYTQRSKENLKNLGSGSNRILGWLVIQGPWNRNAISSVDQEINFNEHEKHRVSRGVGWSYSKTKCTIYHMILVSILWPLRGWMSPSQAKWPSSSGSSRDIDWVAWKLWTISSSLGYFVFWKRFFYVILDVLVSFQLVFYQRVWRGLCNP